MVLDQPPSSDQQVSCNDVNIEFSSIFSNLFRLSSTQLFDPSLGYTEARIAKSITEQPIISGRLLLLFPDNQFSRFQTPFDVATFYVVVVVVVVAAAASAVVLAIVAAILAPDSFAFTATSFNS